MLLEVSVIIAGKNRDYHSSMIHGRERSDLLAFPRRFLHRLTQKSDKRVQPLKLNFLVVPEHSMLPVLVIEASSCFDLLQFEQFLTTAKVDGMNLAMKPRMINPAHYLRFRRSSSYISIVAPLASV